MVPPTAAYNDNRRFWQRKTTDSDVGRFFLLLGGPSMPESLLCFFLITNAIVCLFPNAKAAEQGLEHLVRENRPATRDRADGGNDGADILAQQVGRKPFA